MLPGAATPDTDTPRAPPATLSAATQEPLSTIREDSCFPPPAHESASSSSGLAQSSTSSSASAALARSIALYLGFLFRRPSKLFRPSRVDTWGGLRRLATSADQTLSPSFIRSLVRSRSGLAAILITVFPPLLINTSLGFLLFTTHSLFSIYLSRLAYFRQSSSSSSSGSSEDEPFDLHTLLQGPNLSPRHATLLSGIAGAGAGILQGIAFTPVENLVRLLRDSATSLTGLLVRTLRLPLRANSALKDASVPSNPVQAVRSFLSSSTWHKNASWWAGWRWTVARDAVSYACFFAAFDLSRRSAIKVRTYYDNPPESHGSTSTKARVAQAGTIVAGGVSASLLAEIAGRPFREAQRLAQNKESLRSALRARGVRPFFRNPNPVSGRVLRRVAWRLAAVGPWGFGFLAWAWVGGEI